MRNIIKFFVSICFSVFVIVLLAQQINRNINLRVAPKETEKSVPFMDLTADNSLLGSTLYGVERDLVYNVSDYLPFEDDEIIANQMRVGRVETPNDPSVPASIGDGMLPFLMFVLLWLLGKSYFTQMDCFPIKRSNKIA